MIPEKINDSSGVVGERSIELVRLVRISAEFAFRVASVAIHYKQSLFKRQGTKVGVGAKSTIDPLEALPRRNHVPLIQFP